MVQYAETRYTLRMFSRKFFITVTAALVCAANLFAEDVPADVLPAQAEPASSSEITFARHENDGKKHYLTALSGAFVTCGGIFLWNKYMIGSGWTKVTWDYATHFYEHAQSWDKDWYWTNFVLHPYQGSLSYMVGRNANLNVLESFALATLTDFTWEYFCETNAPSKNDLVYSSLGAFPVGEMLYRLSLEADQLSSLLGYAINPERIWSEAWTKQKPRGTIGNIHELALSFDIGTNTTRTAFGYDLGTQYETFPVFASPKIAISYNDPYGHDSNQPYQQFNLDIAFAFGVPSGEGYSSIDQKIYHDVRIISDGMIFSRAPTFGETISTFGIVMEYDFIWNNVTQLSSLAPGLAFKQRIPLKKSDIEWQLHGAWIALGTTEFDYFYRGQMADTSDGYREYSYTTGAELVGRLRWKTLAGQSLSFDLHGYAMYDFYDQKQDALDTGWELIGLFGASYELPLSRVVHLGVQDQVYVKKTLYNEMDDLFLVSNSVSAFAKFQLK